jgi:hypothetical protein
MVAEVVHGAPYRFTDPARFSFAHGGKDRHPFPVPLRVYDETIRVLTSAVSKARLRREEELGALKRLDEQAWLLEHHASGPDVEELIAREEERSHLCSGRTVSVGHEPRQLRRNDPGETAKIRCDLVVIGRDLDQRSNGMERGV